MFDTLAKWVPLLITVLPFVFFCWVNAKNNLKKEFRNRQFLMPVFALIYSIVTMIFANKITTGLLTFIKSIPEYLEYISEDLADMVGDFIKDLNLTYWIFLIANIVILIAYMLIKKVFISICSAIMRSDNNSSGNDASLHVRIVSNFYTFQNDKNLWTVQEKFGQSRILLCWFYVGAVVISSILFLICKDEMADETIKVPFFPVFGIMLVGELYFFLNGYTNFEYINEVLCEDEESYAVTNYSLMRKVLRHIFPDRLMTENTVVTSELESVSTNDEVIKNLLMSEEPGMENFGTYIKSLNDEGIKLDYNYISSTVDLLNGKSVLFNNPFYKDMSLYAFYPMNRELLRHKKGLIILGRHGIESDICEWVRESMTKITTVPDLWKVGLLSTEETDYDIGIIPKSDVLNVKLHEVNDKFLNNVSYVMIIEPSKIITTAQVGINAIVKRCSDYGEKKIVYCACDKNCDGLVDALSHILMTDLSEVCATNKNSGTVSYMCWDTNADYTHHRIFPNISRYLGFGTELSFVALKNQISKTRWYGGEAYPVTDQFWIDRQYYYDLLKYAGRPIKQEELTRAFSATPNLWSAKTEDNSYLTVEDEGNNLFEMLRLFSTRVSKQGFVNVISPNYLLKEYMIDNSNVFENDPKAIPRIVADYARTERNITLRLIMMLVSKHLCEDYIIKEFSLVGIKVPDIKTMLWYEIFKWFSSPDAVFTYDTVENMKLSQIDNNGIERKFDISIIRITRKFDLSTGTIKDYYYIDDTKFIECNVNRLMCAEYIAEDEKGNINYLGSELLDHVFHKHIPGQLFTFNGKYYEFRALTSDNRVLIRRAADHIDGRKVYRQIRHYRLSHEVKSEKIGDCKDYNSLKIYNEFADISVKVPAYLEMTGYEDFETAKTVVVNGIPERSYRNKQILRIELPDATPEVKYVITILFNEIFRTIFAEDQAYLSAVTKMSDDTFEDGPAEDEMSEYHAFLKASYPLTNYLFCDESADDNSIYIIEDSQLDLGLLIAVERNIKRILEMVYDYLDWHMTKTEVSANPPVDDVRDFPDPIPGTGIPRKKSLIERIKDFFRKLFKKKKKDKPGDEPAPQPEPEPQTPGTDDGSPVPQDEPEAPQPFDGPEPQDTDTDEPENGFDGFEPVEPDESDTDGTDDVDVISVDEPDSFDTEDTEVTETDDSETEVTDIEETEETDEAVPDEPEEIPEDITGFVEDSAEDDDGFVFEGEDSDEPAEFVPDEPEQDVTAEPEQDTAAEPEQDAAEPEQNAVEPEQEISDEADTFVSDESDSDDDAFVDFDSEDDPDNDPNPPMINASKMYRPRPLSSRNTMTLREDGLADEVDDNIEFETEDEQASAPDDAGTVVTEIKNKLIRPPYHVSNYLMFGSDKVNEHFEKGILVDTLAYLTQLGLDNSALTQARRNKDIAEAIERTYHPYSEETHYCDFCGVELSGTEYEVLVDGRERCMQCGRTAVKTGEEFTEIFKDVLRNMEAFFGIRINVAIKVEMVNSKKLAKRVGQNFIPTSNFDARTIGLAVSDRAGYTILIENGSPRVKSMMTIAHELTHIWQYLNWDEKAIAQQYGKNDKLEIYEGMATWVEIQYAAFINETAMAKRSELNSLYRDDEYGRGFKRYLKQYSLNYVGNMEIDTPFKHIPPLK